MQPYPLLEAVAVPIDDSNIDTGRIFPSRFLRRQRAEGYHRFLFHDERFGPDGQERPGFVMNQPAYRAARILVAGANFACGSSREPAVYALVDAGFRCVIASGYGDIFFSNCFRNGLLPVVLAPVQVASLRRQLHAAPGASIVVDLARQVVRAPDGVEHAFDIDPARKRRLALGLDDAALAREYLPQVRAFEARHAARWPWAIPA